MLKVTTGYLISEPRKKFTMAPFCKIFKKIPDSLMHFYFGLKKFNLLVFSLENVCLKCMTILCLTSEQKKNSLWHPFTRFSRKPPKFLLWHLHPYYFSLKKFKWLFSILKMCPKTSVWLSDEEIIENRARGKFWFWIGSHVTYSP